MMMTGGNQQEEKKEIVQNLIMEMAIHNNHGDNNTTSNNSHDNSNNSKGDDSSDNNNSNNGDHNNTSNNSDNNNNSRKGGDDNNNNNSNNGDLNNNSSIAMMSRKEKRKVMKKMKRKQVRKDIAMKEREEEEARLNDPEEQMKLVRLEQEEAERMARERAEFEEREKQFLRDLELKKLQEEEEEKQRKLVEESQKDLVNNENANDENEDDGWEYVEEGPAEIIWKGNEIIVKKKKVRVPKQHVDFQKENKESERPISNPLAPQSEVFEDYRNAQDVLETVAQQVPNFGTEQDKEHCPFHLKTGVCRFGARCSRVHFYPDKACTLLLKNMYHGPGLAWEQDEGLEYTDEEAEQSFEDFYEDVHTEFLKFGEIVNFKVCRNGSSHLRGNVYVHYRLLESAVLAYQSINGRYFAGKQLTCEYVNVTRWRVAICGEYMKSRLKTCSRGSACNFIHCFRNPSGDYEWADWDKPAPRYWLKSMAALFGHSGDRFTDEVGTGNHSRRSRSKGLSSPHRKNFSTEDDGHRRQSLWRYRDDDREANSLAEEIQGKKNTHQDYHFIKHRKTDNGGISDGSTDGQRSFVGKKITSRKRREPDPTKHDSKSGNGDPISAKNEFTDRGFSDRCLERSSTRQKRVKESTHKYGHKKDDKYDMAENAYAVKHHDKFYKHKGECFSQEKVDSSNIDCQHDTPDSEENKHHRRDKNNLRWMKNDEDLSSSTSEGSRLCRVKERTHNRRKSSKWKSKRSVTEIRSNENSLDSSEDRHHSYADRSSKLMTNISDSSDGGGRLGRDEKRLRKSSRLKTLTVTDTESDSDNARFQRHSKKHSRERKNDADLSYSAFEADRCGRYEKRPQKSRRTSSRSHKESDLADLKSNRERIDGEERHHRHRSSVKRHIKEPRSSKVDTNAYSQSRDGDRPGEKDEVYDGNFQSDVRCKNLHADLDRSHPQQERTDDQGGNLCGFSDSEKCYVSSDGGLVPGSDLKRCGKGHILQINKTDEEATGSAKVDTCFVGSSYQDFDAEAQAELEMACRHAALKKLEEIRKDKDTQAAHNREPVESFKICARENVVTKGVDVSAVPEESGSGKLEPTVTPMKRRRV